MTEEYYPEVIILNQKEKEITDAVLTSDTHPTVDQIDDFIQLISTPNNNYSERALNDFYRNYNRSIDLRKRTSQRFSEHFDKLLAVELDSFENKKSRKDFIVASISVYEHLNDENKEKYHEVFDQFMKNIADTEITREELEPEIIQKVIHHSDTEERLLTVVSNISEKNLDMQNSDSIFVELALRYLDIEKPSSLSDKIEVFCLELMRKDIKETPSLLRLVDILIDNPNSLHASEAKDLLQMKLEQQGIQRASGIMKDWDSMKSRQRNMYMEKDDGPIPNYSDKVRKLLNLEKIAQGAPDYLFAEYGIRGFDRYKTRQLAQIFLEDKILDLDIDELNDDFTFDELCDLLDFTSTYTHMLTELIQNESIIGKSSDQLKITKDMLLTYQKTLRERDYGLLIQAVSDNNGAFQKPELAEIVGNVENCGLRIVEESDPMRLLGRIRKISKRFVNRNPEDGFDFTVISAHGEVNSIQFGEMNHQIISMNEFQKFNSSILGRLENQFGLKTKRSLRENIRQKIVPIWKKNSLFILNSCESGVEKGSAENIARHNFRTFGPKEAAAITELNIIKKGGIYTPDVLTYGVVEYDESNSTRNLITVSTGSY